VAVTDTLRPISVRKTGGGTVVPSGTMAAVTSDNSDSTYISMLLANAGSNWNLRVESHTPAAGYQRHAIRGRVRIRTDVGTATEDIDVGRGSSDWISYGSGLPVSNAFATVQSPWFQDTGYGLNTVGALADLNIGGGWFDTADDGAGELRTSECYIDIDCRLAPQYSPQVQDDAGANQNEGTVTDTNQPTLFIGAVDYDGLPSLNWFVNIRTGSASGPNIFSASGSGVPPTEIPVTIGLDDGTYWAVWGVRSTIRGADSYENAIVHSFSIQNTVPPPSPPLVEVEAESGGYRVTWNDPGGQPWDNNYVVAELWRDDCNGSQRIATVPDGLNGTYLDLAIPQLDPLPVGPDCEVSSPVCDITYRVRYLGYVSTFVELPDTIPADLILGWPSTAASIPSGWTRVTALDGFLPRGANADTAPSATGGAATHAHTLPSHNHTIGAHSHAVGGSTGTSNSSTTSARFNGASQPQADQPHSHTRPSSTGSHGGGTSGSATPTIAASSNVPPVLDVIWIKSNGAQPNYPAGILGWATEAVSGWTNHAASASRYLRGAAAAGNGGATAGATTHTHPVSGHTHTGLSHDHSIGSTSLSNPSSSTEAGYGSSTPRWLPRHTHPMDVGAASTGNTTSAGGGTSGGTTNAVNHEPPNRRLRVLQNTGGGTQTRIIGLFTGAISALDPLLTWCNGSGGTPDMRTWFARDLGADSINSTGGSSTHAHTTPSHAHDIAGHTHTTNVLASTTGSFEAPSFGDLGSSPTTGHDHSSGNTGNGSPEVTSKGSGNSSTSSHLPPYKEVHFVRLDGTISGGPLPVPELKISDFASASVPSFTYSDGLDRLASFTTKMAVVTDRSSAFPKLVADSTPLDGGLHTVASTPIGEDLTLTIAVEGKPAIDALEELLASDRLYWSPLGGTSGWFAPGGWTVNRGAPGVWVVQITMVRQDWPTVDAPEDFL
jgi:hypothetical protein